jgi:hypothetical protein
MILNKITRKMSKDIEKKLATLRCLTERGKPTKRLRRQN